MIHNVISAWSVYDQPRDQCIIHNVISAWSATWSVYDKPRDKWMITHGISEGKAVRVVDKRKLM